MDVTLDSDCRISVRQAYPKFDAIAAAEKQGYRALGLRVEVEPGSMVVNKAKPGRVGRYCSDLNVLPPYLVVEKKRREVGFAEAVLVAERGGEVGPVGVGLRISVHTRFAPPLMVLGCGTRRVANIDEILGRWVVYRESEGDDDNQRLNNGCE